MEEVSSITLGNLVFPARSRSGWLFSGLKGWWGATANKKPSVKRPQKHGSFPATRALRDERPMSFDATYIGQTQAELEDAFDTLAAVGADEPVLMIVTTPAGSCFRTVTVSSSDPDDHHGRRIGTVAVDVLARDSRRYMSGEWVTTGPPSPGGGLVWPVVWPAVWPGVGSSGRVTLANNGKAPSPSRFLLAGGFSSALITCVETGARVAFNRPTPAGTVIEINSDTRRATLAGQDVSRWLGYREWTDVPGLMSRSFQFDVTDPVGSPTLSGKVDHAWW